MINSCRCIILYILGNPSATVIFSRASFGNQKKTLTITSRHVASNLTIEMPKYKTFHAVESLKNGQRPLPSGTIR